MITSPLNMIATCAEYFKQAFSASSVPFFKERNGCFVFNTAQAAPPADCNADAIIIPHIVCEPPVSTI
ncbi:MAG: hypothetical protein K2G44_04745 [Clostridia bacterium]|nr:hypothetical protein [Clostridia bacterium]